MAHFLPLRPAEEKWCSGTVACDVWGTKMRRRKETARREKGWEEEIREGRGLVESKVEKMVELRELWREGRGAKIGS